MKIFRCTHCDNEDNILQLIVEEGVTHTFRFNDDLSLEHMDSNGDGQEIYLQCNECATKYEFVHHGHKFALELQQAYAIKRIGWSNYKATNIELEDLEFTKVNK